MCVLGKAVAFSPCGRPRPSQCERVRVDFVQQGVSVSDSELEDRRENLPPSVGVEREDGLKRGRSFGDGGEWRRPTTARIARSGERSWRDCMSLKVRDKARPRLASSWTQAAVFLTFTVWGRQIKTAPPTPN